MLKALVKVEIEDQRDLRLLNLLEIKRSHELNRGKKQGLADRWEIPVSGSEEHAGLLARIDQSCGQRVSIVQITGRISGGHSARRQQALKEG